MSRWLLLVTASMGLWCSGCATPGPPRAPSLQIPGVVTGLEAVRRGGGVELGFDLPAETTEGLLYRGKAFHAAVCRAVGSGTCVPVSALADVGLPVGGTGRANLLDALPPELAAGPVRLLTYRVELRSDRGRTAGYSDAAYSAAGAAPEAVGGLRAAGARQGVVVRWSRSGGEAAAVVLRRETLAGPVTANKGAPSMTREHGRNRKRGASSAGESKAEEAGVVWLSTSPKPDPLGGEVREPAPTRGANGVLDEGAVVGGTYRYAAERQLTAKLGGHTVVLRSPLSAPVEVALRAVYPPPAPTDLAGTMFAMPAGEGGKAGGVAVDLIWTPADDPNTIGYNIVRTWIEPGHPGEHSPTKLNDAPVKTPSFHDVLPPGLAREGAGRVVFQYSVTAVDANGMESPAVTTVVGP